MLDKFMLWILKKEYKYHRVREMRYSDIYCDLLVTGQYEKAKRCLDKFGYHNERCARIDTLIYSIEGP